MWWGGGVGVGGLEVGRNSKRGDATNAAYSGARGRGDAWAGGGSARNDPNRVRGGRGAPAPGAAAVRAPAAAARPPAQSGEGRLAAADAAAAASGSGEAGRGSGPPERSAAAACSAPTLNRVRIFWCRADRRRLGRSTPSSITIGLLSSSTGEKGSHIAACNRGTEPTAGLQGC